MCEYAIHYPPRNIQTEEVLYDSTGLHGPDLTGRGRSELLRAISDNTGQVNGSQVSLAITMSRILDAVGLTFDALLQEYAVCMHRWLPLMNEAQLGLGSSAVETSRPRPLVLLSMFLVTRPPDNPTRTMNSTVLYMTIKQMHAMLQAAGRVDADTIRALMIVVIYECAHGLTRQAYVTLSSCVAMVQLFEATEDIIPRRMKDGRLDPLHIAILVLDR